MSLELGLQLCCGLCWTAAYVEIIRLGLRDQTYGMPFFALALNLAWEAVATLDSVGWPGIAGLQGYINLVWCLFDLAILYTYFRFGRRHLPAWLSRGGFVGWSLLVLGSAMAVNVGFVLQFDGVPGAVSANLGLEYSAALSNLLMSVLFIDMFVRRGGATGQSVWVAVLKMVGTFSIWLILRRNLLIDYVGPACVVFDGIYVGLLVRARWFGGRESVG